MSGNMASMLLLVAMASVAAGGYFIELVVENLMVAVMCHASSNSHHQVLHPT